MGMDVLGSAQPSFASRYRATLPVPAQALAVELRFVGRAIPQRRDRLRAEPGDSRDRTVRPVGMSDKDTLGPADTVRFGQRQTVQRVGPDGEHKRLIVRAVKQARVDVSIPALPGCLKPV